MNLKLKKLFDQDQEERDRNPNPTPDEYKLVFENDTKRREIAQKLIDQQLQTAEDYYHAAFIFHHGRSSDDYAQAVNLAKTAVEMNYPPAKWIYAVATDRYLISIGKLQKFGSQYFPDQNGVQRLAPVDPTTTDQERLEYGIKPLDQISKI